MRPLFLFDFDGVIADSMDVFEGIIREALDRLGHNFLRTRADFLDLFRDNLYASFAKRNIPPDDLASLFAYIEDRADFSKIGLYDGICDAVKSISKAVDVAIVSSNREVQIERILKHNKAVDVFGPILGVNASTSKVEKIRMAMERFGTLAKDTYYVVDTTGDLNEAREAKVSSVGVGWGWHGKTELMKFSPGYFVESPAELVKLAEDICQRQ